MHHEVLVNKMEAIAKEICKLECQACATGKLVGHNEDVCGQPMHVLFQSKVGYFISSIFATDKNGIFQLDKFFSPFYHGNSASHLLSW